MRACLLCSNVLSSGQFKYCSNTCQLEYQYKMYICKWQRGEVDGNRGTQTRNLSRHVRRYLLEKFEEKCAQCGWSKRHLKTGVVPLEIDHVDGNAENNKEENLRVVCPNCHALTDSFRNLNIGQGRVWRKLKYKKE